MSFNPATIQIPEDLLASMLVECQMWRAMVAYPLVDWEELKPIVAAGGIDEGDAALRIENVYFDERVAENPPRPRCVIRQFDDETSIRDGGFSLSGNIVAVFELSVPDIYSGQEGPAIYDARKKLFALKTELLNLGPQGGRMPILSLAMSATGINDPVDDGSGDADRFLVGVFAVQYDGGAC